MAKRSKIYDCIVVGAGMAGLVCARTLLDESCRVLILEGRDRVGGRILTRHDVATDVPIELGAEFIHGAPQVTLDRLRAAGISFYDVCDNHLHRRGEKLAPMDFFEKVAHVISSLDAHRSKDRSMDEFLKAHKSIDAETAKMLRTYIEGFHAADTHLIGERALALAEKGRDDLNGVEAFRIQSGYAKLASTVLQSVSRDEDLVRLNTVVKKIKWERGHVDVTAESSAGFPLPAFSAKKIVVTVPLGVLKAPPKAKSAIEFEPRPAKLQTALDSLHMGHAMRLILRFRSRFWEDGRKEPVGYLHAGAEWDFPTWWTTMPVRSTLLTAWQGGPKVEKLAKLTDGERVQTALLTLSHLLDVKLEFLQAQLETWYFHDWSNDPYSLGAYSYVGLDGDRKAKVLAEPFSGTLFFAGEATHTSHERGTVDGAIDTGLRAARQVLNVL